MRISPFISLCVLNFAELFTSHLNTRQIAYFLSEYMPNRLILLQLLTYLWPNPKCLLCSPLFL